MSSSDDESAEGPGSSVCGADGELLVSHWVVPGVDVARESVFVPEIL